MSLEKYHLSVMPKKINIITTMIKFLQITCHVMEWYKLHFKFSNGYRNIGSFYHVFTMSSCVAHRPF
jgi:hypothetical protein